MRCNRRSSKTAVLAALAFLLLAVPLASAYPLVTGLATTATPVIAPLTTLAIEASVPATSRSATLTIAGRTKPGASIQVFINGARVRIVTSNAVDGTFTLSSLALTQPSNAVKLEAHDGAAVVSADYTVLYDGTPPKVTLDKEIPAATQATSLTVSGDVDEHVTIYYRNINRKDSVPPDILANLKPSKVEANAVELSWDPSTAQDFKEYLVSRDGKRVAVTALTSYRDANLLSGKSYSYSVSPVDTSCNIGTSSDVTAITKSGANVTPVALPQVNLSCEPAYQTTTAGSPFSFTIPLLQGTNDIELIFEDAAGNRATIRKSVLMDNQAPRFLENNLAQLSPSYNPDVTVKGKLDKQGTVFLYVNNDSKPSGFVVTDPDGSFSIRTHLRTDVRIKKGVTTASLSVGEGWANSIRLEAVDLAGNKGKAGPYDVDFLLCGQGTWWQANIGEALPTSLLPRLMMQGVQQIGIPFNITYIGSEQAKLGKVTVNPIPLAPSAAGDYDHDWVRTDTFTRAMGPKDLVGYVQIQFENVDPLPNNASAGPNAKEVALSDHRKGDCLVPGVGCVKLFLQMEIQFQQIVPIKTIDPRLPVASPQITNLVQRVCMPLDITIDKTVPLDIIPHSLLSAAIRSIGKVITLIDNVLKPLTTIGEYVLYGCLASNVWLYFEFFQEKLACDGSSILSVFGEGAWNKAVAEAGLCDAVYGGTTADSSSVQKQQACKKCETTISARKKFEMNVMHGLCDRIGCPSAPTFSSYIRSQSGQAEELKIETTDIQTNPELAKWAVGGSGAQKIFAGNDCAFTYRPRDSKKPSMDFITPTYGGASLLTTPQPGSTGAQPRTCSAAGGTCGIPSDECITRGGVPVFNVDCECCTSKGSTIVAAPGSPAIPATGAQGRMGIRELYDIAKGQPAKTFMQGPSADDCRKPLHPAHPNCCGVQYQKDWSSACGLGTVLGSDLDTFDELKQSTCLSAQQANANAKDLNCNSLWNSVAGFCEKNTGEPRAETINTGAVWAPPRTGADENAAYIFVLPAGFRQGTDSVVQSSSSKQYEVWLGYAVKTPQIQKLPDNQQTKLKNNQFPLSASMTAGLDTDLSECFGQKPSVRAEKTTEQTATRMEETQQIACVKQKLGGGACAITPCQDQANIKKFVQQVNEVVQVPDQQYIVRPSSGLFRSVQCICLPAVTSYLIMWQKVLGAFHGCFSKIMLTGEGSAGFCAAKFSGTICDLFFEAISCFVQKFNSAGAGGRAGTGGFSNILGALTSAGTDVSKSVSSRYGDTALYQSLFSERKLLHAICTWAFTGTWSMDMKGLFQQQVEQIPVDTEGALTTCQRTFIAYDPTTQPSGLTTWAYRISGGLIAGADVRYRLKLKCSSGFTCDPRAYKDGKCDCPSREQVVAISDASLGNGLAKKFDLVNFDSPFVINAQSPDSGPRYDTAMLEWDWTDPTTKQVRTDHADCSIRETEGGNAPAFCAWDAFSGKFRCLFGQQDNGVRMTLLAPTYPLGQDRFGLGQRLNFAVDLKQQFPDQRNLQQQSRKFLTYDIKDGAGMTVQGTINGIIKPIKLSNTDSIPDTYTLATNGAYRFIAPKDIADGTPLGDFVLDEDTIKRHSVTGTGNNAILQSIWPVSTIIKPVTDIRVSYADGRAYNQQMWFSVDFPLFKAESGAENFNVYRLNVPSAAIPPAGTGGWAAFRAAGAFASGKQSPQNPLNTVIFNVPSTTPNAPPLTVTITFQRVTGFTNANELELAAQYNPPTAQAATNICDAKKPVTWYANFAVYDADKHGNPTDQVSTDPDTGEAQQKSVPFQVQCAKPDTLVKPVGPAVVIGDDNIWLQSLASIIQQQNVISGQWNSLLVDVTPAEAGDANKVAARVATLRDNSNTIKSAATLALNEINRQTALLKDSVNKATVATVPPGIGGIIASADRSQTALTTMLSTNKFDITDINAHLAEVRDAIKEAQTGFTSATTAIQQRIGATATAPATANNATCASQGGTCGVPSDSCLAQGGQAIYNMPDCAECCKTTP
jgi:hypothetical protein